MSDSTRVFEPLKCEHCKKNVLESEEGGFIVMVEHEESHTIDDIFVCCSNDCYEVLKDISVGEKEIEMIQEIEMLKNPVLFLQYTMEWMDNFHKGMEIDEKLYDKLKTLIIRIAQYTLRELSEEEKEEVIRYHMNKIKY